MADMEEMSGFYLGPMHNGFKVIELPEIGETGLIAGKRLIVDEETRMVYFTINRGDEVIYAETQLMPDDWEIYKRNGAIPLNSDIWQEWDQVYLRDHLIEAVNRDEMDDSEYVDEIAKLWLIRFWLGKYGENGPSAGIILNVWRGYQRGLMTTYEASQEIGVILEQTGEFPTEFRN